MYYCMNDKLITCMCFFGKSFHVLMEERSNLGSADEVLVMRCSLEVLSRGEVISR